MRARRGAQAREPVLQRRWSARAACSRAGSGRWTGSARRSRARRASRAIGARCSARARCGRDLRHAQLVRGRECLDQVERTVERLHTLLSHRAGRLSLLKTSVSAMRGSRHEDWRADADELVEPEHVGVTQAHAAVGDVPADQLRLVGAVDRDLAAPEPVGAVARERAQAERERPVDAAGVRDRDALAQEEAAAWGWGRTARRPPRARSASGGRRGTRAVARRRGRRRSACGWRSPARARAVGTQPVCAPSRA